MTPPPFFGEQRMPPIIPHPHDETEKCPGGCDDILVVEETACKMKQDITELDRRIKESHDQMSRLERRSDENAKQMIRLETRADEAAKQMVRVEIAVSQNSAKLDRNNTETSEIHDFVKEAKALVRVVEKVKWFVGILGAAIAFYIVVQGLK